MLVGTGSRSTAEVPVEFLSTIFCYYIIFFLAQQGFSFDSGRLGGEGSKKNK